MPGNVATIADLRMIKKLSIIIPVFNEKKTIFKLLEIVERVELINKIEKELILALKIFAAIDARPAESTPPLRQNARGTSARSRIFMLLSKASFDPSIASIKDMFGSISLLGDQYLVGFTTPVERIVRF